MNPYADEVEEFGRHKGKLSVEEMLIDGVLEWCLVGRAEIGGETFARAYQLKSEGSIYDLGKAAAMLIHGFHCTIISKRPAT